MLSKKYKVTNYTILIVLAFSTVVPALVYAAPLANDGKDWQYTNGNSWGWNYSPQNQINKSNVQNLEVKWIFQLGSKSLAPAALQTLAIQDGSTTPPIVRNGVVYVMSNYMRTYAVDAKSGKQLWVYDYTLDVDTVKKRLPASVNMYLHSHGIRYWETGDAVLNYGLACDIYAIDAKTGKEKFRINDLCLNIPGNLYNYMGNMGLPGASNIATYEKGRQFIYVLPGTMHSTLRAPDARHVTMGISMDPPYNVLWKVFSSPPYDIQVKDWALQECDIGFFRDIPCSEVAAVNRAGLEWDFALPNQTISKWAGVTANWGQPVVDEDTGILYTQTGNQGPYSNMSLAPGPRLYGSTIMALDITQGKRIWWLQPFPHDPYDYDCNWGGLLIDNPKLGKVYVKGCKEGVLYVMDAKTGTPKYKRDVTLDQLARGQITDLTKNKYYAPDPKSFHDLREWNWISWPAKAPGEKGERFTLPVGIYPGWNNGLFSTDLSFDPETQTLIYYETTEHRIVLKENPYIEGGDLFITSNYPIANTTIVARDLATGEVKWTWFYPYKQRAALAVSGGLVVGGFTDGTVKLFDKDTGTLLRELVTGSPVVVGVTIGKDSDGNSKIFMMGGTSPRQGDPRYGLGGQSLVPGTIIAIGLSDRAAGGVQTTTVTTTTTTTAAATTVTSTTTSVSVTTTTAAATTITSTIPATTTTITSTLPGGQTTTITSTIPAQTITTTIPGGVTTITSPQAGALPVEVTYAAIAIAVIAIIAAAVLVMRKR